MNTITKHDESLKVETENHADFLSLPGRLYPPKACPRNRATEKELLEKSHVLSHYFELFVFTARRGNDAAARCALTIYPGDTTAYLGFFDSENDREAATALFEAVERFAMSRGLNHVVGPVDASFWLGYRLKINKFDKAPYFAEPCGLPWYQGLWEHNGYRATDLYSSHAFVDPPKAYHNEKFAVRLRDFLAKGYRISSPDRKDWDKTIGEIYGLIVRLYSDFPVFKFITEHDFRSHYAELQHIVDWSMVKVAYWHDEAVGFFISVPDYGCLLNQPLTPSVVSRALLTKKRPGRYVMLYMGVDPAHTGLGKAITQTIISEVVQKHVPVIGALIHEGKINERYVEEMIAEKYHYLLFEKSLGSATQ
jgi:hypothetical protein